MKLEQAIGVNPPTQGGGMWIEQRVYDLGLSQDPLVVRTALTQEALYRGVPMDAILRDQRRQIEKALGDALFGDLIP